MKKKLAKSDKSADDAGSERPKKHLSARKNLKETSAELLRVKLAQEELNTKLQLLQDLHISMLTHVKQIQTEANAGRAVASDDAELAARKFAEVNRLSSETVAEIRRAIGIIDSEAEDSNISLSVDEVLNLYRGLGLEIKFSVHGTQPATSSGMNLSLYKMLKEALENSLQFGGPGTSVDAVVTWGARGASLTITDDGIRANMRSQGMDEEAINSATKYDARQDAEALFNEKTTEGIKLLKKRVELYGGTLMLTESPGLGLSLTISIPDLMNGLVFLDH